MINVNACFIAMRPKLVYNKGPFCFGQRFVFTKEILLRWNDARHPTLKKRR